ncbi:MAG: hypothetical protein J6Y88_03570 [Bacteroidales bacterium]|nr:hypothetical protein [Bacteroidales bacterium]
MKKTTILMLTLACVTALCSCFGGKSKMDLAVGSSSIDYHLDKAKLGLLGPVKSVEIKKQDYKVEFDALGDLAGADYSETKYLDRARFDATPEGNVQYTFDELGRVVVEKGPGYMYAYEYEGDYYFPASMTDGKEVHKYTYKSSDFDKYGNWTSRKDNGKSVSREIEYYK